MHIKRRAIIRRLQRAGFAVVEGASHTKLIRPDGRCTVLARHNDLPSGTVRAIERQTGVQLRPPKRRT